MLHPSPSFRVCIPCLHAESLLWTLRTQCGMLRIPMLYKRRTLIRRIRVCLLRHKGNF
jgi:hypothetical protein